MRATPMLLLLLLCAVPAVAQERAPAEAGAVQPTAALSAVRPLPPELRVAAPARVQNAATTGAAAAAQPSVENFLYQVLLAAVTALVTALVWRALD